jgi:Ca-activated chloride channel family protein
MNTKRALTFFAAIATCSLCTAYPGEGKVLSDRAYENYQKGKYDQAEELYKEASEKSPSEEDALKFNEGSAKIKNGKFSEAVENFKAVYREDDPKFNASARYNAGIAHHLLAHKAQEAVSKAGANAGGAASTARDTSIDELKAAIEDYRNAMKNAPTDMNSKYNYELAQRELNELLRQKEQEQQQQNKQNKDQQNQKQNQNQNQKNSSQSQQNNKQNSQQSDQQNQQDKNQNDQQKQQDKNNDADSQDKSEQNKKDQQKQQQKNGTQPTPTPNPTPQPTPSSDQNKQQQANNGNKQANQQPQSGSGTQNDEDVPIGEMSPKDVERLLNSLPDENKEAVQKFLQGDQRPQREMENDW